MKEEVFKFIQDRFKIHTHISEKEINIYKRYSDNNYYLNLNKILMN